MARVSRTLQKLYPAKTIKDAGELQTCQPSGLEGLETVDAKCEADEKTQVWNIGKHDCNQSVGGPRASRIHSCTDDRQTEDSLQYLERGNQTTRCTLEVDYGRFISLSDNE